jgi:antitoxin component YwqK of YwqJK toxin-antitoxin module
MGMTRTLLLSLILFGGCAASTATTPIHTHQYAYKQTMGTGWAKGRHHDGRRHGKWEFFDETGRKLRDGEYRDGVMHGMWTFYFENGDIVTARYRNGVQVIGEQLAATSD